MQKIFEKDPTVKRHIVKTISWRLVGSVDTMLLGWLVTGRLGVGISIGGMELLTKMLLYFGHERVWHRIGYGIPGRANKADKVKRENRANLFAQVGTVSRSQREALNGNPSFTIWLTGLSASGKSTIATGLDDWLFTSGLRSFVVDGDNTRLGINSDLSFTREDRSENIRRVAELCRFFNEAGVITIASFISPFEADRQVAKDIIGTTHFVEIFVDASIDTCKARDKKGLYQMAESGKLKNFTGVNSPYEQPNAPDIHLNTNDDTSEISVRKILDYLFFNNMVPTAHQ